MRGLIRSQSSLPVELLDRGHQPIVFAALLLQAAGQFAAHRLHGPATKIVVDKARGRVQIGLRKIQAQHAISHQAGSRHQHGQNFLIAEPGKVHMLKRILGPADGHGNAHIVRDQGEHVRSALHEFLHIGNTVQRLLNHALIFVEGLRELALPVSCST